MRRIGQVTVTVILGLLLEYGGAKLNVFVMNHNHNQMPVLNLIGFTVFDFLNDPIHSFMTWQSHYKPLCDIIPQPAYNGGLTWGMISPGDVAIYTGQLVVLFAPLWLLSFKRKPTPREVMKRDKTAWDYLPRNPSA